MFLAVGSPRKFSKDKFVDPTGLLRLVNIYHACSEAPSTSKQIKGSPKTSLYGTSRTR
jgi:hypothetical protein